jgi:acyl carrier protein
MINKDDIKKALTDIGVLIDDAEEPNGYKIEVMDSITYINTIISLEEIYDVEFEDEYLTGSLFNSIDQLVDIINLLQESKEMDTQ